MMCSSSSSSSSFDEYPIPKSFKFLKILGEGGFGKVIKCVRRGTEHTVAIKIARDGSDVRREANMLKFLMHHKLDKFNIVKFYGEVIMDSKISLMLEVLDIDLMYYLSYVQRPVHLGDIRTVIEQLATAFNALKKIGVIHADVKLENILMVDHVRQPFRVKLSDFGSAFFSSKAKIGKIHQTPFYRAPEIILGLPFSEAIDIWSMGSVMAAMLFGVLLFPAKDPYVSLQYITDLLGPVPEQLLDNGQKTTKYFKKNYSNLWVFKTHEEYCGDIWGAYGSSDNRCYTFRSLDNMKEVDVENTEVKERIECIKLLKEMLNLDGSQRITPSGILNHPFITKSYLITSSHLNSYDNLLESAAAEPSTSSEQTWTKKTKVKSKNDDSLHPAATPSTCMDSSIICQNDNKDKKKKKKKKRNYFTRFFSWMKKIFTS